MCQAKLVAEPWDVGQMDGYDLGRFPALWREWNGKYRDTMRDFWRSHPPGIGEFADRFTGSDKHNEANGEDNRDGTSDNNSSNCGVKGPTGDEITWCDWASADTGLRDFTRQLIPLRKAHPVFRPPPFPSRGRSIQAALVRPCGQGRWTAPGNLQLHAAPTRPGDGWHDEIDG